MPPIIGITTSQDQNEFGQPVSRLTHAYILAVQEAGGVPVLIPSLLSHDDCSTLYARLDGILLSGGGDIAPGRFGGQGHRSIAGVDNSRDELELGLIHAAAADGKPFLGICRGYQAINVAFGGTLYTHLPDQLPRALNHDHPGNERKVLAHTVDVEAGTRTSSVVGDRTIHVNSHHHQGLKDIGAGLRVAGVAPDGLVEAVELPEHPFGIGVLWHPEWLTDQAPGRSLFAQLVAAAAQRP